MVEADSGAIGGKDSHEFILPAATGEDTIITCSNCEYAANLEKAICNYPTCSPSELLLLEEIHTPGITTISGLEKVLKIDRQQILKSIIYVADKEIVGTVIRGDLDVNEVKLRNVLKAKELKLADSKEISSAGLVPGFISPVGMTGIKWIGDNSIKLRQNYVAGGNQTDLHFKNINWSRDFAVDELVDMAEVNENGLCVNCNSPLQFLKGIEVGHIFKLGTFFSEKLAVNFLDQDGKNQPVIMGCYGIGIGRLLAAAIEQNHDEKGIVFPVPIAPYSVHLVGLNLHDEDVINSSNSLYSSLWQEGIDCLFDDRIDESAGVKFNDADLMGFPIRVVVSRRGVEKGNCEIKFRSGFDSNTVPLTEAQAFIKQMLATMKSH
jgi:prolyl-tRNA synthetase